MNLFAKSNWDLINSGKDKNREIKPDCESGQVF
jgi:hypothetical protein